MKPKTSLRWAGILFTLVLVSLSPMTAFTQEGDEKETFEAGEPAGWEFSEGTLISAGQLVIPPNNFAARFGDWSELTLTVQAMVTGPGELSVHYAFTDTSRYILHFIQDEVVLEKVSEGSTSNLAFSPTTTLATGKWVELSVSFMDGRHEIQVNGDLLLEAADPEPLPAGGLLFQTGGERTATFEEIQISRSAPGSLSEGGQDSPAAEPVQAPQAVQPTGPDPNSEPSPAADGGTFEDLLAGLFNRGSAQVPLSTFVGNLFLAAIFSFILSRAYVHWGSSLSNRRRFASNFMLITITTTFIILVVRSSVALSLGLVGALSIVRFRTAIKEPEELAYLFFAIGLGIGLGDNQRMITLVALAVGIALIGLLRLFRRSQADINLHLSLMEKNPENVSLEQIIGTIDDCCSKWKLIRYDEGPENLEAAFLVEFQDLASLSRAKQSFSELSDSIEFTFLDNRGLE